MAFQKEDYNKAECYVLHKDLSLRTEMRIALAEINVKCREFSKWSEVVSVLEIDTPSFMILSVDGESESIIKYLPQIRAGQLSKNPFMPIAALTYYTDPNFHLRLIEASFNTHLQGPFSNRQLKDCVKFLAEDRRLFIANGDYIGPEDEDSESRSRNPEIGKAFAVPNTLQDHVDGIKPDFKAIDTQLTEVLHERVRDAGYSTLKFFGEAIRDPGLDAKQLAGKLGESCKDAKKLIDTKRFPHAAKVFQASERFCGLIAQNGFGKDGDREMANKLVDMMEKVVKGQGDPADFDRDLQAVMAHIKSGK